MGCTGGNTSGNIAVDTMTTRKPRSAALPGDQEAYRGVAFERNESAEGWKRRKAQAEQLAKLPKRVWGKSRNVTDNSPTRLGAHRAALSYPKHSGVSWVWLAIAILVKVKCTLRGLMLRFWAILGRFGPIRVTPRESHGICNRNV